MINEIHENILISVICTVKNAENTLTQTLSSVLCQDHENWELIIVDDGSEDSSKKIIESFSHQDSRIIPIYTNGIGRGKALNLAIENSNGHYIANIDADDLMHKSRLGIQLQHFIKQPEITLVCSNVSLLYNQDEVEWEVLDLKEGELITDKLLLKNRINHSSVMFNKKSVINIGKYDENLKSQFDYELWLRILANGKIMIKIPQKLVAKRIHKNQSFENKKRIIYLFRSQKLQLKYSKIMKKKFFSVLIITPIRIIMGLLPFDIRRKINAIVRI